MKKILLSTGISLAAIFLALCFAELLVRLLKPQLIFSYSSVPWTFPCFQANVYSWVGLKPNAHCIIHSYENAFPDTAVDTNSAGIRNKEVTIPKPTDTVRILVIGDSFTMGWGVKENQSYPRRLETILRARYPNQKIEVINAGVPATGPSSYYLFLKYQGVTYQPDYIVIGFYPYNDVAYDEKFNIWKHVDTNGLPQYVGNSAYLVESETGVIRYANGKNLYHIPALDNFELFRLMRDFIISRTENPSDNPQLTVQSSCIFKNDCHDMDMQIERTQKLFIGMKQIANRIHASLLVTIFPVEFQVHPDAGPKYGYILPVLPWEPSYLDDLWSHFFTANNISSLDLLPSFLSHASENIYFSLDDHPTSIGLNLAAQDIAKTIIDSASISSQTKQER